MNAIKCFAWQDNDPRFGIYLYSISETERGVRTKMLEKSIGWRYDHGRRDEEWKRLLTFGRIVPVVVSLEAAETIEASEATDGTAIGWTIVQVNSDGSILCRDPRGTRRRFWFDNLLSALQQCLAYIERDEQRYGRQLPEGRAARAAIEKAKGEK